MALVVLVLVFAFAKFPGTVSVGVAFERGRRAEAAQDYANAATRYEEVVKAFPDSTLALARLAVASHRAGDDRRTVELVGRLEGREMSQELMRELDGVVADLRRDYGSEQSGGSQ